MEGRGTSHRRGEKLLLPGYLWILLLGSLLISSSVLGSPLLHAQTVSEQYLLAAANRDRASEGLSTLAWNAGLSDAARRHAAEMARRQSLSHQFAGEAGLAERAGGTGLHFSLVTENVADASNAVLIENLWLRSAEHRANLLDPLVNTIGVAVVVRQGQLYAVEDFARTLRELTLQEQEDAVTRAVAAGGTTLARTDPDARATCALPTGYRGPQPWFVMRYTSSDIDRLPALLTAKLGTGKYRHATIGACALEEHQVFSAYRIAVLLFP